MLNHKYTGFVVGGCFLLSLLVSGLIFYQYQQEKVLRPRLGKQSISFPNIPAIDKVNIQRLSPKISALIQPSADTITHIDLRPLGYRKSKRYEAAIPEVDNDVPEEVYLEKEVEFNYQISMIYVSRKQQNAVINGKFVRRGDSLADGGRVLRIQKKRVLIEKSGVSKWIYSNKK